VDYDVRELTGVWLATNAADTRNCQENQIGVNSPAYDPAPYSPVHEAGVTQFVHWYCTHLRADCCRCEVNPFDSGRGKVRTARHEVFGMVTAARRVIGQRHWRPPGAMPVLRPATTSSSSAAGDMGSLLPTISPKSRRHPGCGARARLDRRRQHGPQYDHRALELSVSGERAPVRFSLKLYEGLSQALNFNIMLSQRGLVLLAHSRHDLDAMSRWANAMRMNGIAAEILTRDEVGALAPALDLSPHARLRCSADSPSGVPERRGMTRSPGVRAGRFRPRSGHHPELRGRRLHQRGWPGGRVNTSRGRIRSERVGIAAAGHSSVLAKLAGFRLPVTSYALQAMVSEPIKPLLDTVILSPARAPM